MVGTRLTPPSVQDGPFGLEPGAVSNFDAPSQPAGSGILRRADAKRIGLEIYEASTNWLNAGRRARWNDSLRAFQSLHPSGSKYLSGDYRYRSTLFRPKTRSMVRRDEAATASAFFSNDDVVSISPANDGDPRQQASAEILKALLQYRLADAPPDERIPWFLTVLGARQDCEVMGVCIAEVGWDYRERKTGTDYRMSMGAGGMPEIDPDTGMFKMEPYDTYKTLADRPFVDLIAPENFRFEPGCDWRDPVRTSPYLIKLDPVYISEAQERMESGEWFRVSDSALRGAVDLSDDVTRRSRESGRVPGKDGDAWKPRDFDICWTRHTVLRWRGRDWVYRTLAGTGELLEDPKPIEEVYLHGMRPYVVGSVVLEAHKTYPSAKVELTSDLQRAANTDWNSRFDAVMLNLQPRQFVREGSGVEVDDLRMFMPGKTVFVGAKTGQSMADVVTWDRPPPVDGASFQEQDRINLDWDELVGAYTNSSVQAAQVEQQSATGMHLMSGEASGMNEYELRMFAETFVEPLLHLLVKTEQAYETDPVILGLAGKKAQLFQRFGTDQVTDEMLNAQVTVKVNVGIGATNPNMKLRNFASGAEIVGKLFGPIAAQGANFKEVTTEIFGLLGYKDGERFFQPDFDPRMAMLQQQLQKLQGHAAGKQSAGPDPMRLQTAQIQTEGRIREREIQAETDRYIAQADFEREKMAQDAENWRVMIGAHARSMDAARAQAHQSQQAAQRAAMPGNVPAGPAGGGAPV